MGEFYPRGTIWSGADLAFQGAGHINTSRPSYLLPGLCQDAFNLVTGLYGVQFTSRVTEYYVRPPGHTCLIDPYNAEIILSKSWKPKGFNQFESIINVLVSSFWFIWIPVLYGSTTISDIFIFTVRGSTLVVRIWRLYLTTKVDPRAVRVNPYNASVFPDNLGFLWKILHAFSSKPDMANKISRTNADEKATCNI